jgi:NMD protein affecting ribosome stability and mRNA decay
VTVNYVCEQCGRSAALCVSDWGYIAALCDRCMHERKNYLKLPGSVESSAKVPAEQAATV